MPVELGRSCVRGKNGIVATSQRHAARVGASILSSGGNAADAAVATAAALAVAEPCSAGLGGDCFALYYDRKSGKVTSLNGSGRSPLALSIERLRQTGALEGNTLEPFSPHTVTVPGAAAAWLDLLDRHGSMDANSVFSPAIELADRGFEVGAITSYFWKLGAAMQLARWKDNPTDLSPNGAGPEAGEVFRNPNLAQVLGELADGGKDAFYRGRIGAAIADAVRAQGGWLDIDDLAAHQSEWNEPISSVHRGIRVFECPPNGQGLTALIALNVLAALEGQKPCEPFDDRRRLHRELEALRLAFADARRYIADPSASDLPTEALLSSEYAAERASLVDRERASIEVTAGSPHSSSDTVYLAVVDADGNACSLIFSNYMGFGTGIVPAGCGFTLQNRGHNFSLELGHANALAGGKRPYHTIIPALGLDAESGGLRVCFGVMGGFMQPQGHLQTLRGLVCDGLDPQTIVERPRFLLDPVSAGSGVALEETFDPGVAKQLEAMGHRVRVVSGWRRSAFGRGQMIENRDGELLGGSDPRGDGCAVAV